MVTQVLLGVYFIIIGLIGLFGVNVDPKLLAALALVIGVLLLIAPRYLAHRG